MKAIMTEVTIQLHNIVKMLCRNVRYARLCLTHTHTVQCPSGGRAHKELSQLFSAPCAIYYITSIMKEPNLKNLFSL